MTITPPYETYMTKALKLAERSLKLGEVPIGALVIDKNGLIIGRGFNKIEIKQCQTAHAEIQAIAQACKKTGDWRLNGCTIYVTLEPCLMCLGLIQLSRIEKIVYGAPSPLFGSGLSAAPSLPSYAKNLKIEGGILSHECAQLLQSFFKNVRKNGKVLQ
jgi:tRNA(adenine34) deaminase